MTEFEQELLEILIQWRRTARSSRLEAEEIDNLLARGHLLGLSDGLDLAAVNVEALLDKYKLGE